MLIDLVAPIEDPDVRAEVEAGLLRWAAGRVVTPAQLRERARREVARRDARAAARRLERALRRRGVHLSPEAPDGLAAVTLLVTEPEAQVFYRALGAYADQIPDDPANPRTREQKMADCLMDLVLRPDGVDLVAGAGAAHRGRLAGHPGRWRRGGRDRRPGGAAGDDPRTAAPVRPAAPRGRRARPRARGRRPEPNPSRGPSPVDDIVDESEQWLAEEEWWADVESRVLAELVDPDPEPIPPPRAPPGPTTTTCSARRPHRRRRTRGRAARTGSGGWASTRSGNAGRRRSERRILSGELALLDPDRPPAVPPPTASADAEEGWWAAADRAVDDASLAVRRAGEALGHAGRLVRAATAADADDEDDFQAGPGRFTSAGTSLAVLRACTDAQRQQLADLLDATGGGGLLERPRIALTDALTGALLALTDLPELRRTGTCGARACRRNPAGCTHDLTGRPGLGPPGPTDGYRPGAKLDRYLRARDRRCRQPGCRRRVPRGGELDHNRPIRSARPARATSTASAPPPPRQAPGAGLAATTSHDDGTLTVTTPTGLVAATEPPPY